MEQDEPICNTLAAALQQLASQLLSEGDFSITLGAAALPITAQTSLSADAAAVQASSDTQLVCCSPLSIQQQCWHSSMRTFCTLTNTLLLRTHAVMTLPALCNESILVHVNSPDFCAGTVNCGNFFVCRLHAVPPASSAARGTGDATASAASQV